MGLVNQWRTIRITCADSALLINRISSHLLLKNVQYLDQFTVQIRCQDAGCSYVHSIAEKLGAEVRYVNQNPLTVGIQQLIKRPILALLIAALLCLSIYLPKKIFFFDVAGNHNVPTRTILETAENCGIRFGASRSFVRSEQVKNYLLEQIPQLQWVGVNTSGCVANIQVLEKTRTEDTPKTEQTVCSIVAARDGIITQFSATKGTALCKTGQAVKRGQVLISGYTDNGLTVTAAQAEGEVQAVTNRSLQTLTPVPTAVRGKKRTEKHIFSIRIGKKLIKLQKDSGISGTGCAKIYEEDYVCLPGGFPLPISLIKTTEIYYETQAPYSSLDEDSGWLTTYAQDYLRGQMIGGQILKTVNNVEYLQDHIFLQSEYTCREMIGRVKYEESMYQHGEND